MNKENLLKQLLNRILLFPQISTVEAYFNTGHPFSSNKDYGSSFQHWPQIRVLLVWPRGGTYLKIDRQDEAALGWAVLNQWLVFNCRNMSSLFVSFDLNLKISWKIPIHTQVKLISDKNFLNLLRLSKFNSGLYLQTTVEFWYLSKFEYCCDLRLF